ncbi:MULTISPECIES: hypothetical protein [unclassified Streptomyces]|uniref:hypothetical protein n=1 Tax=unclassified Streptomyces TaxID=2593676 RepID=UPI001C1CAB56|nr:MULTISPECIES: hypothetical protein [unclassified Streptomyces]MBT2607738.1 hypothetical protein [Streptomyces sp. ISL-87]
MITNPDIVFAMEPRRGLVARSGWEQEEVRTVLRDLGWEWAEELHAFVPPDDAPEVGAGVQAVEELHLHGHRTGYSVGRYGAMRLTLDRAEQVFTKLAVPDTAEVRPEETHQDVHQTESRQWSAYSRSTAGMEAVPPEAPESPAI